MSLQLLAKQMEAKGRKGDSMLVHMTPDEVAGLQKLAESAGGSLSVNPETGLVEANFLKKMLPTLIGAGLMLTPGGMPLAIAGGALVGGLQAKKDDKDFLSGALMGGLGAYGGASLAGGLMAAGAPGAPAAATAAPTTAVAPAGASTAVAPTANAVVPTGAVTPTQAMSNFGLNASNTTLPAAAPTTSAATTTAPATFSSNASQAGQGIANLGTKEGAAAFGKEFGFKQAMAGAAPMLVPEDEKVAEAPVDDEMYVYDFDYGRTGADRMVGGTSSERTYFNPEFSNRRKVRAADYFSAAEGGEVADAAPVDAGIAGGMSGASKAAFDYLMGNAPSSAPQGIAAPMVANTAPASVTDAASDRMYVFNPATGAFTKNPNYKDPAEKPAFDGIVGDFFNPVVGMVSAYDQTYYGPRGNYEGGNAAGGLIGLAKGGMKSGGFVIPADVVSMVGEGNTDAGYTRIKSVVPGATAIKGKDGGQADTVKTSIEGKQPARVAHGEMYVPPETVKRMGGAKKLYAMMDKVRAQATGSKKQIKPVSLKKALA